MSNDDIRVSVYFRNDRKQFFLQYRDPETGNKVRRKPESTTRRAVDREAAVWQEELNKCRGAHNAGRILWEVFRSLYEEEHVSSLADRTDDKIAGIFNTVERVIKPNRLGDLNEASLSRYSQQLRRSGRSENTIKGHLDHISAALSWAEDRGLINKVPKIRKPKRARKSRVMKGRPIAEQEFESFLAAVPAAVVPDGDHIEAGRKPAIIASWQQLLTGLWWSGLRLSEAVCLHWTDRRYICVERLEDATPMLWVPDAHEKGHEDRILPMAPEFAEFLRAIPPQLRSGYVFNPIPRRKRYSSRLSDRHVGRVISSIGKEAGVEVRDDEGKVKFASAHDLRRSFGDRWSKRVMPAVLKELMRHDSIETTMRYYIGRDAEATAAVVWSAYSGDVGHQAGNHANTPSP